MKNLCKKEKVRKVFLQDGVIKVIFITFSINIKKEKGKYIKNITALRGIQEMAKKNGNEEREEECIRT